MGDVGSPSAGVLESLSGGGRRPGALVHRFNHQNATSSVEIRTREPSTESFALEVGLPLLAERLDPLVRVPGHENAADGLALYGQAEVQRCAEPLLHRELGVAQCNGWPGGDLRRVLDR